MHNILLTAKNNELFIMGKEFHETISACYNYVEVSEIYGINKTTIRLWNNTPEDDVLNMYKKIIASFMLHHNKEKTKEFMKKYNLPANNQNSIISIMFEIDIIAIDSLFSATRIGWKQNFFKYLKSLNRYLFVEQVNEIRKRIGMRVIQFYEIESMLKELGSSVEDIYNV